MFFSAFYGSFAKLSLKPELQLQLGAQLGLSLALAYPAPNPQPDEFNLASIEQYLKNKTHFCLSIGPI